MTKSEYITVVLAEANIPIVGASDGRVDFADNATDLQKTQAATILASLDVSQTAIDNYTKTANKKKIKASYNDNEMAVLRATLGVLYAKILETRQRLNAINAKASLGFTDLTTETTAQIIKAVGDRIDADSTVTADKPPRVQG